MRRKVDLPLSCLTGLQLLLRKRGKTLRGSRTTIRNSLFQVGLSNFQFTRNRLQRQHILPLEGLTHWQHPSFFAYFPTAATFEGLLGDLYANSTMNPGFNVRSLYMLI